MSHTLALVTVVYENYTVLQDFLKSLDKQENQNFKLFIVDLSKNRQIVKHLPPNATLIHNSNKGYAYGINIGLRKALSDGHQFFCILNNDIYFNSNFVDCVSASLFNHPSSIIGGKIYYASGYEYHKDRYSKKELGKVLWFAGGRIDWDNALTPHRGVDEVDKGQYDKLEKTDFVNGACMAFDKTVLDRVGFWDESYFLYFEDSDFCMRAQKAGIRLIYDPRIVLWHKNSQSTGGAGSLIHQKYQKTNRLRFAVKYAPLKTKLYVLKNYFIDLLQKIRN